MNRCKRAPDPFAMRAIKECSQLLDLSVIILRNIHRHKALSKTIVPLLKLAKKSFGAFDSDTMRNAIPVPAGLTRWYVCL